MSTNPKPEANVPTHVPVGTVAMYAGALDAAAVGRLAEQGWLPCDGALLQIAHYEELHRAIGHSHGGEEAKFRLPDLRGRFVRGVDAGTQRDPDAASRTASAAGGNSGDKVGSLQDDAFKKHSHKVPHYPEGLHWAVDEANRYHVAKYNPKEETFTQDQGGSETRPLNLGLNFIIRYRSEP
ncbi:MAG TPA: phage tail protein [Thermoanaerobaculia bacterium]|jgi:microcystin-dependent protein|nr:phage tail protein [Thermoanaerobaculia bacterium]